MKRFVLALAVGVVFLLGYGVSASAFHSQHCGYFYDRCGNNVGYPGNGNVWGPYSGRAAGLPDPPSINAIPYPTVRDKTAFKDLVWNHLNYGASPYQAQNRVGAAFIIHTVIGTPHPSGSTAVSSAQWDEFVRRIDYATVNFCFAASESTNTFFQYRFNDIAWDASSASDSCAIAFFDPVTGARLYTIRRDCANPIGAINPLRQPSSYDVAGYTDVDKTTVKPGDRVTFTHNIANTGPDSTSPSSVTWAAYVANPATGAPVSTTGSGALGVMPAGPYRTVQTDVVNVPITAAVGTRYCRLVEWVPNSSTNSAPERSAMRCATVVASYNLTPQVIPSPISGQEGDVVRFTYQVTNSGPTPSDSVACKAVGAVQPPGYSPLPQQDVDRNPSVWATTCPKVFPAGVPTSAAADEFVTIGAQPPGSRICRSLVINPKNDAGGFRASSEACVVVNKKPLAQFLGGDVWAGGGFIKADGTCDLNNSNIQTVSRTLTSGALAGSYSEYGAFALGRISGFGSAATPLVGASGKRLTFANTILSGSHAGLLGYFGASSHCITDFVNAYNNLPTVVASGTVNLFAAAPNYKTKINGNITLVASGALQPGKRQVVYVLGNVVLGTSGASTAIAFGNGPYTSIGDIPGLTVIATGNITVAQNVTRLDGIYVSFGKFSTCDQPRPLTTGVCNRQLVINGAVAANTIDLGRTFGSDGATDAQRQTPGELVNLMPNIFLSGLSDASQNVRVRTTSERDLPPRY